MQLSFSTTQKIIIFLILIPFAVYRFIIKPVNLSKDCRQKALVESLAVVNNSSTFEPNTQKREQLRLDLEEQIYNECSGNSIGVIQI